MYNYTYDDIGIRNKDYSVTDYIQDYYKEGFVCLDLGCGSCRKIEQLATKVACYYAVDSNPQRILTAKQNCSEIANIKPCVGDNFYLPFESNKFDLISCFMTKFSISEASRVLNSHGLLIIETTGANDKRQIKERFGEDEFGLRGRMLYDSTSEQVNRLVVALSPFFCIRKKYCVKFKTRLKAETLFDLFLMTNDIRGFNRIKDNEILQSLKDKEGFINFYEERLIIVAEKIL